MTFNSKLKLLMAGATPKKWIADHYGIRDAGGYIFEIHWPHRYEGQEERYQKEMAEREADVKRVVQLANDTPALSALVEAGEKLKTHLEKGWDESAEPKDIAAAAAACNEFIAALNALNKES